MLNLYSVITVYSVYGEINMMMMMMTVIRSAKGDLRHVFLESFDVRSGP